MKNIILLSLILLLLISASCNTTEPPPPDGEKPTLELTLEDVSCTEAWITLKTTNLQLPTTLTLIQFNPTGDTVTQNIILSNADSLLYIDSLLPNQTYKFIATIEQSNNKSNELSVTTLDTTSHNFTFQSWTFGTIGSSTLYDVAIIAENNIWAVGEIMIADTSINGYTMYNAAHWNGGQWELLRIPYIFQGDSFYNPIYAIFAFNADDIWFGIGNLIHWDGTKYIPIDISTVFPSLVNKIWGSSRGDMYVVGNNGNIAHYNGQSWKRIESGTISVIGDISGIQSKNGEYVKYCAADNVLLRIDGDNNVSRINVIQGMFLNSVWAASNNLVYTAGNGIVFYKNDKWQKTDRPDLNTIFSVNGQSYNDIVGLSSNLSIFHFNGYSSNSIHTGSNNIYVKIQIKNNTIATIGWQDDKALITILYRN
ncbi:MAG TPA: glucosyl transferase [Ignavibacteriaceae bacterium]|nr:glucosyl transferase [Ignavibacteriaceae bacterium]